MIASEDAPPDIVKEVEQYNKERYETEFPGQRYEDRIPVDALIRIVALENGSMCYLQNVGEVTASKIQLKHKGVLLMDQEKKLQDLSLKPVELSTLNMKNRIVQGDTYIVSWKQKEKDFKEEIKVE